MSNRRALIVGIDHYTECPPLKGCVNDAFALKATLSHHTDDTPNFSCRLLHSVDHPGAKAVVTEGNLRKNISDLFRNDAEVALFYFSGHGHRDDLNWYLAAQDGTPYDAGIPVSDIIALAGQSPIKEKIIVLDCCFSGGVGNIPWLGNHAFLPPGVSILAASGPDQIATEHAGQGTFTSILLEGLRGAAADIFGDVTVANLYHFASKILDPWQQRPQFKTNLSRLISIRRCQQSIAPAIIRNLTKHFQKPDDKYPVSPAFDTDLEPKDEEKEAIFAEFRELFRVNLLVPGGEKYLYYAAKNSKWCELTPLGRIYWQMVKKERI